MKNFKLLSGLVLVSATTFGSVNAFALCFNGWATPTTIKYNFKSLSANNDEGNAATLIADPFSVTFNRTDGNFGSVAVSDITLPIGRYISLGLTYADSIDVTLDGVKFDGKGSYNWTATSPLAALSTISTVSATNSDGAIANTGTAVATAFTGSTGAVITYFPAPLCVTDASQAGCKAGDLVYTGTGAVDNTKGDGKGKGAITASLKISLLVDLYDGVVIDGGVGKILGVPAILAVAGDPGAAIHITVPQSASGSTVPFNASLLFGADKALLSATVSQGGAATGGDPLVQSCQGVNNVAITGASANFPFLRLGSVSTTENTNKGQVIFPMISSCTTVATCNSSGSEQIDNLFQAVGSAVTISCVADSTAAYQTAKYSQNYTGGAGGTAGTNTSAKIVRIVDPSNIFGVCATSPCVDTAVATGTGGYL